MNLTLFPTDLPEREWVEFPAHGYTDTVCGVIHRGSNPPVCGVPLGGIDTGCIDLAQLAIRLQHHIDLLIPRRSVKSTISGDQHHHRPGYVHFTLHEPFNNLNMVKPVTMGRYKEYVLLIHYWGHYQWQIQFILAKRH
jgi:hypothetical protein